MAEETVLDRATYKKIKAMDRATMQTFWNELMKNNLEENGVTSLDFDAMRNEIAGIKGIGESRLNEIMDVIKKHLNME